MSLDFNQLNQGGQLDRVLNALPYPLRKEDIIQHAQTSGAKPQVINALKQVLPDQTFNSAEDIKKMIRSGSKQ